MFSAVPARTWTVCCVRVFPPLLCVLGGYCSNSAAFAVGEAGAFLLSLFELFKLDSSFSLLGGCRAFRLFATLYQCKTRRGAVADMYATDRSCLFL